MKVFYTIINGQKVVAEIYHSEGIASRYSESTDT